MKRDKVFNILKAIGETGMELADLLVAMHSAGYGASINRLEYEREKVSEEREKFFEELKNNREERQKFYNLVYKLKRDGLIRQKNKNGKKFLFQTPLGKKKFERLSEECHSFLPSTAYDFLDGDNLIIVSFDIPEIQRYKRDWIRRTLFSFGFNSVHKSVLIGKVKIPEEFLCDLRDLEMLDFVKIFEISKTGNLENLL